MRTFARMFPKQCVIFLFDVAVARVVINDVARAAATIYYKKRPINDVSEFALQICKILFVSQVAGKKITHYVIIVGENIMRIPIKLS